MTTTRLTDTPFDATPVPDAALIDLDLDAVQAHIEYAAKALRYMGGITNPIEFLIDQDGLAMVDGLPRPTVASILFFGQNPQRFLRHAATKLAHYPTDDVISTAVQHMATYEGRVAEQIRAVIDYFDSHIERGFVLGEGGTRRERPQFPPAAYRELTVNAVAHRDYQLTGSTIRITFFRSKLEWISPGSLPPNVTLENILDAQYSRNPTLARFLYQAGFVEEFG
jgi:ATP-dependent DNA helicase RecG